MDSDRLLVHALLQRPPASAAPAHDAVELRQRQARQEALRLARLENLLTQWGADHPATALSATAAISAAIAVVPAPVAIPSTRLPGLLAIGGLLGIPLVICALGMAGDGLMPLLVAGVLMVAVARSPGRGSDALQTVVLVMPLQAMLALIAILVTAIAPMDGVLLFDLGASLALVAAVLLAAARGLRLTRPDSRWWWSLTALVLMLACRVGA